MATTELADETASGPDLDAVFEPTENDESAESPSKAGLSFRSTKVKLLGLLLVVMGIEAAGMYLILPRPSDASTDPAGTGIATGDDSSDTDPAATVDPGDGVEVEIDKFNTTNSRARLGATVHVSFSLIAIVKSNNQAAFTEAANQAHKARVREAVVKIVRSASMDNLNDPDLSVIKRQIREEVNKVLRNSYILDVVIDDFRQMEQ